MHLYVIVSAGEFFLLRLFPLIFGSFEILHYWYQSFERFRFPFESFQIFFFDIFKDVMGDFSSVIAVSERDVNTLLSVPLFDHVASFVAILDGTFSIVIQTNQVFECCVVQHALNPQIN